MTRSIFIQNYGGGTPYQEQIFLNMIQNFFYDGSTYVQIFTVGNSTAHNIKPTDATDAAAIISQINAAYTSLSNQTVITGSPSAPGIPGSPAAVADYGVITISWTAVAGSGITYNIYRGASGAETLYQSGINATIFNDNVTEGSSYYYKISAVNSRGEGALSGEIGPFTSLVPATPTLNSATADYNAIDLAWTAVTGSTNFPNANYNIYVNGVNTYTVSSISTPITSVTASATYTISAVINGIEGSQSSGITQSPLTLSAPVAAAVAGYYEVTISWPLVAGAQSYNIYQSTGTVFSLIASVNNATSSFVAVPLAYESSYSYEVSAYANGIEGPLSAPTTPLSPNQVSGLAASPSTISAASGGSVKFTATGFNSNQGGEIAYGIGSVSYLSVTYNIDGSISATFPGGLTAGSVNAYYVVDSDLNTSTTISTGITFA